MAQRREDFFWRRDLRRAQAAVDRFPRFENAPRHALDGALIVSMTSYPRRFPTLAKTIRSLLDQSIRADRLILWVAHEDRERLPGAVLDLQAHGLQVLTCDDMRSYKKIIPALAMFPDAYIATADDDVYYPSGWLAELVEGMGGPRPAIAFHRGHGVRIDAAGGIAPYRRWSRDMRGAGAKRMPWFPTGVGGVLYSPGSLDPEVMNRAAFERLCPTADDVWLFWMGHRRGSAYRKVGGRFRQIPWEGSQETSLYAANGLGEGNDAQIRAMEREYGRLPG